MLNSISLHFILFELSSPTTLISPNHHVVSLCKHNQSTLRNVEKVLFFTIYRSSIFEIHGM